MKDGKTSWAHLLFLITIAIKGIDGIVETAAGHSHRRGRAERLFFFIAQFTTPELEFNPSNHIARAIQNGAAGLAGSAGFAVFYLLMHGIVKAGIAVNLLRDKRWIFAPRLGDPRGLRRLSGLSRGGPSVVVEPELRAVRSLHPGAGHQRVETRPRPGALAGDLAAWRSSSSE